MQLWSQSRYASDQSSFALLHWFSLIAALVVVAACSQSTVSSRRMAPASSAVRTSDGLSLDGAPNPDPRVGLKAGVRDAGEAVWNLKVLSRTPRPEALENTNSDLAFLGKYAIQGNYNGFQIWDISNPAAPQLETAYVCPGSQGDVSVYRNLLFVSVEDLAGRVDCGTQGVPEPVSPERLLGIRIFDISDIAHPKNIGHVQTCRGSHTHTLLADPRDPGTVYIYVSGLWEPRSREELAGCSDLPPDEDPNSSRFRIDVIKVPLTHPEQAALVNSPRLVAGLDAPPEHGEAPADKATIAAAKARGAFVLKFMGVEEEVPGDFITPRLDSIVKARGGTGAPTGADSVALQRALPDIFIAYARGFGGFWANIKGNMVMLPLRFVQPMLDSIVKARGGTGSPTAADTTALQQALPEILPALPNLDAESPLITQCHDITVYPAIGLAAGACGGYGLLLDISDPAHPRRIDAVADSNFSYWHSATFSNDGTKVLFSDEWGGGRAPKCRASDPHEWGADAIFTLADRTMQFQSYYKMTAPQTPEENCTAHNGSLIPIPGRDIMVQTWFQGGLSVFDWTDARHPKEIAFFDRGPMDSTQLVRAGAWSAYWYNGNIVSSGEERGLDILQLTPSAYLTQNEIDAARTVHFDYLNPQNQSRFVWPATFALARAYTDQLARSRGLSASRVAAVRQMLDRAEQASGASRSTALSQLASSLERDAGSSSDKAKVEKLVEAVKGLAGM